MHLQSRSLSQTVLLTIIALLAFAGNSVLCRLALHDATIDPAFFTIIRLCSGAFTLGLIVLVQHRGLPTSSSESTHGAIFSGSWFSSIMLALYAITFSFAYITLNAGTGALILFAAVQITMILVTLFRGNRLSPLEWFGLLLAFVGFVYLMLPYLQTPSVISFVLMTTAGIAWGFYSLLGQGSSSPLVDTAINFLRTLPLMLVLGIMCFPLMVVSPVGVLWAVLSGSLTSGVGYAIWYKVLSSLSSTQAATLQLLVPVIAALGGVFWIGEAISWRLIIAALLILGGILFVVLGKARHNKQG